MNTPQVGIWWDDGETIVVCSHPCTQNVIRTKSRLDSNLSHMDEWPKVASQLGGSVQDEYFLVPRGRVLYDMKSSTGLIFHGPATDCARLQLIAQRFGLHKWASELDLHYFVGEDADRLFDEE
jgi:hypothetical protein